MADPGKGLERLVRARSLSHVSQTTYTIAGIKCTVYGLAEVPRSASRLAVLWLHHARLGKMENMDPVADLVIHHWNQHLKERGSSTSSRGPVKGLIAVSFDQRNHGGRVADNLANEAWKQGNARHAQDMFSSYHGTALDTSLLISHLGGYLPSELPLPSQHLVLGISLGGHAAWHLITFDPRITAAVVIIGCPDFTRLMCQRATKTRLKSWTSTKPAGASFLGSADFPRTLMDEIERSDPAGCLLPSYLKGDPKRGYDWESSSEAASDLSKVLPTDHTRLSAKLDATLKGKAILNLSGGADKLVPYGCGRAFYDYLKGAIGPGGWWANNGIVFDDRIFDGVGHSVSPAMIDTAVEFIGQFLAGDVGNKAGAGSSRI